MQPKKPDLNIPQIYNEFNHPVTSLDCGSKCGPHNPSGKPFCCDICYAVPSAYNEEWAYLQPRTNLWHPWRGDECESHPENPDNLQTDTPNSMILLACLGPDQCQRDYRSLSCRQFPFFPYITSDLAFIGLTYNWIFEDTCWVISNLGQVTESFRKEFVQLYDDKFSMWDAELKNYAERSAKMRQYFLDQKRSIPLLHREGGYYLLRPINERLRRVEADRLPKYGVYR